MIIWQLRACYDSVYMINNMHGIVGFLGPLVIVSKRRSAGLPGAELKRLFGQVVLQVGGKAGFPLIANSLAPIKFHVVFGGDVSKTSHCPIVLAEDNLLPFPNDSVDILVLQHSLDISAHPHHVLREAERILRPAEDCYYSDSIPHRAGAYESF